MVGFPVLCDDHGVFDIRALAFFAEFLEPGFYCFIIIIRYIRLLSHGHMVITVCRPASCKTFDWLWFIGDAGFNLYFCCQSLKLLSPWFSLKCERGFHPPAGDIAFIAGNKVHRQSGYMGGAVTPGAALIIPPWTSCRGVNFPVVRCIS